MFGAAALVLADLKVLKDPVFKGISVTAERWVPLQQVPPRELLPWLRHKRSQGYTCAHSIPYMRSLCKPVVNPTASVQPTCEMGCCMHVSLTLWRCLQHALPSMQKGAPHVWAVCTCRLVGLEQTVQSTPLPGYAFPPRCCLVLGAEKTGIPPQVRCFTKLSHSSVITMHLAAFCQNR